MADTVDLRAVDQAAMLRRKEISASELLEAAPRRESMQ